MQIGMNEFVHRILALLKQQREMPEKLFGKFLYYHHLPPRLQAYN